jgi:hypothetical protein
MGTSQMANKGNAPARSKTNRMAGRTLPATLVMCELPLAIVPPSKP